MPKEEKQAETYVLHRIYFSIVKILHLKYNVINFYNVKSLLFNIFLISVVLFVFSGCGEEKKKEAKILSQNNNADTSSLIIKYAVTGSGNGKITLTKKGNKVKLELDKIIDGVSNIETRFISDGWIYFYFTTETAVQPVKSRITKDQNYLKNFASLADADEIIARTRKNGNEIVAGFTCDIYEYLDGSRYSIYQGKYVLQASYDGIVMTATSLSFNVPIKNQDVEKPANVDFLELTIGPQ